jgi:hypothetical protein
VKKVLPLIFIVLFAGLLAACQSAAATTAPGSPQAPEANASATPGSDEIRSTVTAALKATGASPHHSNSKIVLGNGEEHTTQIDYIPPDRLHISSDPTQYIVIGNDVYMMEKTGSPWVKTDIPASAFVYPGFTDIDAATLQDPVYEGNETIDGKDTQVYRVTIPANDSTTPQKLKMWVDPAKGLILKMVIEGQVQSVSSDNGQTEQVAATTTMQFQYEPAPTIEAPKPGS